MFLQCFRCYLAIQAKLSTGDQFPLGWQVMRHVTGRKGTTPAEQGKYYSLVGNKNQGLYAGTGLRGDDDDLEFVFAQGSCDKQAMTMWDGDFLVQIEATFRILNIHIHTEGD